MTDKRTLALVEELRALPAETAWVEFKHNNADPHAIGKYLSALANAARMHDKHTAYLLWGIEDGSHAVLGTGFDPSTTMVKNQPLDLWLANRLNPSLAFQFTPVDHPDGRLLLLEIPAATSCPVEFDQTAFIRIGSATPRLSEYPERLKALWAKLQPYAWEGGVAAAFATGDEVLEKLDYASYFELTRQPLPDNRAGIFDRIEADKLITRDVGGHWNITNLGAVLFARQIHDFDVSLARKAVRFVSYNGKNRASKVSHRIDGTKGYASGFKGLVEFIDGLLPRNEFIGKAFREEIPLFPEIAVRELVANALIHQDMTIRGTGPRIELFTDRLEITNPGRPLVSTDRFIDTPPRSRNEILAALMRRMKICEEEGSGIDKVIQAVELYQLPPPDFRAEESATRVILYAPRSFGDMTSEERIRACYQHAVWRYVNGDRMKNASLCERFGIEVRNAAQASQVIRKALDANLIRVADTDHPRAGYIPIWA